ncbi:DUF255 domain-containing protein [Desulfosporosinus burensis]
MKVWYLRKVKNIAKRDNKPIFLSIGYSTCHWWHRELMTQPKTADTKALR